MNGLVVHDQMEQGSPAWHSTRAGIITASEIGDLLTGTGKIADNETSRGFIAAKTAERITGKADEVPTTPAMRRGYEDEPVARDLYAEWSGIPVEQVGLMVRDFDLPIGLRIGYSPDGLVGDDGLIEIKSRTQRRQMLAITNDAVPAENMAQIQCGLLVSGRAWCDYVSYSADLRLWVKRVEPDPEWFDALRKAALAAELAITEHLATYERATAGMPVCPNNNPDQLDPATEAELLALLEGTRS